MIVRIAAKSCVSSRTLGLVRGPREAYHADLYELHPAQAYTIEGASWLEPDWVIPLIFA
jgi:hypothetical protein